MKFFILYLLCINVVSFVVYAIDKQKAIKHKWRISEAALLTLAAIGGSVGALLGMYLMHHKTRHVKFSVGVPVIFVLQAAIFVWRVWI